MELADILAVVRRRWWLIAIAMCLAGAAGFAFSGQGPTNYEARVRLLVGPRNADAETVRAGGQLAATYSEIALSEQLLRPTIEALNLSATIPELRAAIRPTADTSTRLLILRVTDSNPDRAALIANELARQLKTFSGVAPHGQVTIVDQAFSGVPLGTPVQLIVLVAALAGAIAGFGIVLVVDNLNRKVHTEEDLAVITGAPVLGVIPAQRRLFGSGKGLPVDTDPRSARASSLRLLATKIELLTSNPVLRLAIIGTTGAQGSSEVAANIGLAFADPRRRVLLLDANPAGELTALMDLSHRPGLAELSEHAMFHDGQDIDLSPFVSRWSDSVSVVPSGRLARPDSAPTGMDAASTAQHIFSIAEFTVIDAAPVQLSSESLVWAAAADACILVVQQNRTDLDELRRAAQTLALVGANVIGTVLEEGRRSSKAADWAGDQDWLTRRAHDDASLLVSFGANQPRGRA